MARGLRSPIARVDSQLISSLKCETSLAKPLCERLGALGRKVQTFDAGSVARDHELIARQGLAADDFAQVKGKVFERREAAGFGV